MTRPLTEELRVAMRGHWLSAYNSKTCVADCGCGAETPYSSDDPHDDIAMMEAINDHTADVAARVVEAWLGEQRETVAESIRHQSVVEYRALFDGSRGPEESRHPTRADAALAALRAGIGVEG